MSAQLDFFGESPASTHDASTIDVANSASFAIEREVGKTATAQLGDDGEPVGIYEVAVRDALARGERSFSISPNEIACVTCKVGEEYHRDTFPCESREAYLKKCVTRFEREKCDVALGGRAYPAAIFEQNVDSDYYEKGWGRYVTLRAEFYNPKSFLDTPKWFPIDMNRNGRSYLSYSCAFSRVDDHPLKEAKWFVEVAPREICNFDLLGNPSIKLEYDAMLRQLRKARSNARGANNYNADDGDGMECESYDGEIFSGMSRCSSVIQSQKKLSISIAIGLGL